MPPVGEGSSELCEVRVLEVFHEDNVETLKVISL